MLIPHPCVQDPAFQDYDGSGAQDPAYQDYDGSGGYAEPTLAETVADFLGHLSSSPGSFDADVGYIVTMLNAWVTTEELLKDLVELIYTQVQEQACWSLPFLEC